VFLDARVIETNPIFDVFAIVALLRIFLAKVVTTIGRAGPTARGAFAARLADVARTDGPVGHRFNDSIGSVK
jgi:hypothetical protein